MDNLLKKLQDEVGLTPDQATKSIKVIKDFMDKEGLDIDWDKFFKGKYESFLDKVKNVYGNVSKSADSYTDKLENVADDISDKAKKVAHDLTKKATDFFDGDDDKK